MLLVKVNDTKSCFSPLVATKSETSWYPYVDGCGLKCENVLYTEADHAHAHYFIAVTGILCFFCTLFTVVGGAVVKVDVNVSVSKWLGAEQLCTLSIESPLV